MQLNNYLADLSCVMDQSELVSVQSVIGTVLLGSPALVVSVRETVFVKLLEESFVRGLTWSQTLVINVHHHALTRLCVCVCSMWVGMRNQAKSSDLGRFGLAKINCISHKYTVTGCVQYCGLEKYNSITYYMQCATTVMITVM